MPTKVKRMGIVMWIAFAEMGIVSIRQKIYRAARVTVSNVVKMAMVSVIVGLAKMRKPALRSAAAGMGFVMMEKTDVTTTARTATPAPATVRYATTVFVAIPLVNIIVIVQRIVIVEMASVKMERETDL
jgi:hypothetical protein